MRYAILDKNIVINVIEWDGDKDSWQPPDNTLAVPVPDSTAVYLGDSYIDGEFRR
jgi:hypothetical protein